MGRVDALLGVRGPWMCARRESGGVGTRLSRDAEAPRFDMAHAERWVFGGRRRDRPPLLRVRCLERSRGVSCAMRRGGRVGLRGRRRALRLRNVRTSGAYEGLRALRTRMRLGIVRRLYACGVGQDAWRGSAEGRGGRARPVSSSLSRALRARLSGGRDRIPRRSRRDDRYESGADAPERSVRLVRSHRVSNGEGPPRHAGRRRSGAGGGARRSAPAMPLARSPWPHGGDGRMHRALTIREVAYASTSASV